MEHTHHNHSESLWRRIRWGNVALAIALLATLAFAVLGPVRPGSRSLPSHAEVAPVRPHQPRPPVRPSLTPRRAAGRDRARRSRPRKRHRRESASHRQPTQTPAPPPAAHPPAPPGTAELAPGG